MNMALQFEFMTYIDKSEREHLQEEIKEMSPDCCSQLFEEKWMNFVDAGCNDKTWRKNFELLEMLQILMSHYKPERTRNYSLRQASIKKFIPFAFTSGCSNYAPLLMELLFHTATQQERYTQVLENGYFTHQITSYTKIDKDNPGEDGGQCVYVGWDNVAENLNLHQSKARHRGQSIEQSKQQSTNMGYFMDECRNMDTAAFLHGKKYKRHDKDDRSTRTALLTELIEHHSFKPAERKLINEFTNTPLNEGILKSSWAPAADQLMRKFAQEKELCKLESLTHHQIMGPHQEITTGILTKIKKSTLSTIKIDTMIKESKSKSDKEFETESKKLLSELRWKNSTYGQAAAICTPSGDKINPTKSSFRHCVANLFQTSNREDVLSHHLTSDHLQVLNTEHAKLYNLTKKDLILLCPMPLNLALTYLSRKTNASKTMHSIVDLKTPAILQICKQNHWVTLLFNPMGSTIYCLDSLGKNMPTALHNTLQVNFSDWIVKTNTEQFQFDSYQCGVWSAALVQNYIKSNIDSAYIPFHDLIKQLNSSPGNKMDKTSMYSAMKRNEFKKLLQEHSRSDTLFVFNTKPEIKLEVMAVDAQHTLWINPSVSSGQEYYTIPE